VYVNGKFNLYLQTEKDSFQNLNSQPMKTFLDENFLLQSDTAQRLYHEYAGKMPIIDYHSHLSAKDIAEDRQFDNLTQVWLYGDHYKWRAMRTNGIDEKYITGNASDFDKFMKWAETVPNTLRNPLYHWTHLELQRYFSITKLLSPSTAEEIYREASSKLQTKEFSVRNLLKKMNVEVVCTTDDPTDTLEYHIQLKSENTDILMVPAWRPDKAMSVENLPTFNTYLDELGKVSHTTINNFDELLKALKIRHDYFHEHGCRLSDHGLDSFYAEEYTHEEISGLFLKARNGINLTELEIKKFKSAMLRHFATMDNDKNWVQQFHIGALRNNNPRQFTVLGPDTGFDSIGDEQVAESMSKFLARLDKEGKLAKTILYNLNPSHNEVYATMICNFQEGPVKGKIQWGSGWWFMDQKMGMERHLDALSSLGLLSHFVGMLTDSRSFLSFPRHEYFRRILCNILGKEIEKGLIPNDTTLVGNLIENICYNNAKNYFSFWDK
jgi:glucuronate isomerase